MNVTILSIPGKLTSNPYLSLLYSTIENNTSGNEDRFHVEEFSRKKLIANILRKQKTVIHIHWETNIYGSRFWLYSLVKVVVRFPILFLARDIVGARIVWTMHNLTTHDLSTHNTSTHSPSLNTQIRVAIDSIGRSIMRSLAQKIIIQNKTYARDFSAHYPHISKKVIYMPHGNYIDAYGPMRTDQAKAREELSIPFDAMVLLALGAIRPYKNLEKLIDAMLSLPEKEARVHLVIAGKGEPEYIRTLENKIKNHAKAKTSVQIIPRFIPDSEIPAYFAAADYSVFAHGSSSLTSGALLLALSYGTPAITLPMPASEIIEEGKNGYVVKDIAALEGLLERLETKPPHDPYSVRETVAHYSWEHIGSEMRALYVSLFLEPKRASRIIKV